MSPLEFPEIFIKVCCNFFPSYCANKHEMFIQKITPYIVISGGECGHKIPKKCTVLQQNFAAFEATNRQFLWVSYFPRYTIIYKECLKEMVILSNGLGIVPRYILQY